MALATANAATTFEELDFQPHNIGNGVHARTEYPNGYGASVVRFHGSYGYESGLYELGVLEKGTDGNLRLTYEVPITNDVLGSLTPSHVTALLQAIAALPSKAAQS